jgi:uncharacterized protein YqjF (DUF2071 family)
MTTQWRYLAVLNWKVDPGALLPYVPDGTLLDLYKGQAYISIVGFLYRGTRLLGLPIPGHRNFEELNLRFYVRRPQPDGYRRGVVFVREFVPRRAVAAVARWCYNENFTAVPMTHHLEHDVSGANGNAPRIEYRWRYGGRWNVLSLAAQGAARLPPEGSQEHFILDHYWGYSAQRRGGTLEYEVTHRPWRAWQVQPPRFDCDAAAHYPAPLAAFMREQPASAYLVDGSEVTVFHPRRLTEEAAIRRPATSDSEDLQPIEQAIGLS